MGGTNVAELEGKVCVVTGGAGSLGLATARLMLSRGARVMLVDMSADRLKAATAGLDAARIATATADVTSADDTRACLDATVARFGNIDVIFANAGNDIPPRPIVDTPDDAFDSVIATHVRGCFLTLKYGLPRMNDGGSIILTSSIAGVSGVPGSCAYVAAKHALMGLMRTAAKEVAARRIRVNSVNPGPVNNEFMRAAERSLTTMLGHDAHEHLNTVIPLGRHAEPDEVAEAVCFLASPRSSYTTGSALMVDGALTT
jgi:NAD(P)-dependent dehydrogenase (short-subunit alcohol dehydrogenase family)